MRYTPCVVDEIIFAKELMEKWGIGQNELKQYISSGLLAYHFPLGKRPKIQLKHYSCELIGQSIEYLPQIQEDTDGFEHWVVNWDSIVFDTKEIVSFEKANPELYTNIASQNSPMVMDGYSCLKEVLLSEGILDRWPGMEPWELAEKIDKKIEQPEAYDFPPPYWMRKHKVNPATKGHIYFCEQISTIHPYSEHYSGNETLYDFEMIALDMQEVLRWEKGKDWLFFVDPTHENNEQVLFPKENVDRRDNNEWVEAAELQAILKLSPSMFCAFINKNKITCYSQYEDFGRTQVKEPNYDAGGVSINDYTDYRFHIEDIKDRSKNIPELKILFDNQVFSTYLNGGSQNIILELNKKNNLLEQENKKITRHIEWYKKQQAIKFAEIEALKRNNVEFEANQCVITEENKSLKQSFADLKASNQELQSHLDAASAPPHRWKPSCDALFQAFRQVVETSRDDWVQDEFLALAGRLYDNNGDKRGVLAEAGRLAWAALPDRFKAGPGNPKYKGNPTKE